MLDPSARTLDAKLAQPWHIQTLKYPLPHLLLGIRESVGVFGWISLLGGMCLKTAMWDSGWVWVS
jgi:hypothetical protein